MSAETKTSIKPGEIVNLLSDQSVPASFAKSESFQAVRLVLPAGKEIPVHQAKGPITVQCLSGRVTFHVDGQSRDLIPGCWLFLEPQTDHSLIVLEDSVILVTKISP